MPRNQNKTHCLNGHEYSQENTWYTRQGWRKCRSCELARHKIYQSTNLDKWYKSARGRYQKYRADVFALFGEACKYCGFDDTRALHLDHINGGGSAERKRLGGIGTLMRALKFPEEYQILCANCNWIKRTEEANA